MTRLVSEKRWLSLAEAAQVAGRSERTMRNWVRDGVLIPRARGVYARDDVLRAESRMRNKAGRPAPSDPRVVEAAPGVMIEIMACGKHTMAVSVGLFPLTCERCRVRSAESS